MSNRPNSIQASTNSNHREMFSLNKYLTKVIIGFHSLLKGMKLTLSYFSDPRKVVTQQYPENRDTLKMMPRFRGGLTMPHDSNNTHNCTGCGICEKACPNGSISVLTTKDISGRKILGKYIYRLSQCTFCNFCIEACPYGAIQMSQEYELAVYNRENLVQTLNQPEDFK